jgi:hypothetical protein
MKIKQNAEIADCQVVMQPYFTHFWEKLSIVRIKTYIRVP